jgi:hypothetical protein
MVLVCRPRNFIYLKTHRTGSTSTESYFERECVPPEMRKSDIFFGPDYPRIPETVTEHGVIGFRGNFKMLDVKPLFRNHMSAKLLRSRLEPEFWDNAFKFCNVRNPFDKAVSAFWGRLSDEQARIWAKQPFAVIRAAFREWLCSGVVVRRDVNKYMINGEICIDDFVRYEALGPEIQRIGKRLGIPFDPARISHWGSHKRGPVEIGYFEYFDSDLVTRIEDEFAFELEYFGYRFGD